MATKRASSKILVTDYGNAFTIPLNGLVRWLMARAGGSYQDLTQFGAVNLGELTGVTDFHSEQAAEFLLELERTGKNGSGLRLAAPGAVRLTEQQKRALQAIVDGEDPVESNRRKPKRTSRRAR